MSFQITLPSKPTPLAALDILDAILEVYSNEETQSIIPEFEAIVATEPLSAYCYARSILKGRFELGEPAIATDAESSYEYACEVIQGRFELGEPAIATRAPFSYWYACEVIQGRFELGEPEININPKYKAKYNDYINSLG